MFRVGRKKKIRKQKGKVAGGCSPTRAALGGVLHGQKENLVSGTKNHRNDPEITGCMVLLE